MAKLQKPAPKKSVSKAKAASVTSTKPRLLQVLVGLMIVLVVVFVGTMIYTKMQERDVKAKAAAFNLRPQDYADGKLPKSGVRLAVCRKGSRIVGIVTHPASQYKGSYVSRWADISKAEGANSSIKLTKSNPNWFKGDPYLSFVEIEAIQKDWITISYVVEDLPSEQVSSKRILAAFIPSC